MDRSNEVVATAVRWFEEVWNQRRKETIDELLDESSVCHAEGGPIVGPEGFRQRMYTPFLAAIPDLFVTVEDAVAERTQAVVRWSASGTLCGPELGIRPARQAVALRGITWIHVRNGKLGEGWQYSNLGEVLASLAQSTM